MDLGAVNIIQQRRPTADDDDDLERLATGLKVRAACSSWP